MLVQLHSLQYRPGLGDGVRYGGGGVASEPAHVVRAVQIDHRRVHGLQVGDVHPFQPGRDQLSDVAHRLLHAKIAEKQRVAYGVGPAFDHRLDATAEDNLQVIFGYLSKYGIRINLMQNSAVSFQICISNNKKKVRDLIDDLEQEFRVSYETGLELITIRYYDQSTIDRVMINKELILEQRYKQNIQLVVRDLG